MKNIPVQLIILFGLLLIGAKMVQPENKENRINKITSYIDGNSGNGSDQEISDAIYKAKVRFNLRESETDSITKLYYN